jgi:cyclic pyranopterin phosphate synthase
VFDRFERDINYLRISVTDRCNLRCIYCMPSEGIQLLKHSDILTYDEITSFCRIAVNYGVTKVRLTGGEPLARKGISALVRMLSDLNAISDLSMTTNGVLLKEFADELKAAGLQRVNISLDTVDPVRFRKITRGGDLNAVLEGIQAALDAGLLPVKINCVIKESENEPDAVGVTEFCRSKGLEIRYIKQMDLVHGHFSTVIGGTGGDCDLCNRLRLTANGKLKPCLFNDLEFDVRELGYEKAFLKAIQLKPACGTVNSKSAFYNIGG